MKSDVKIQNKKITKPTFPVTSVIFNGEKSIFVLKGEHNRKWTGNNKKNLIGLELKIDKGLINSPNCKKCDFGLLLQDNRFYLVELKGKHYQEAEEQLIETKKFFTHKSCYQCYGFTFYARVVCKSLPVTSTELQRVKVELKKEGFYNSIFKENINEDF